MTIFMISIWFVGIAFASVVCIMAIDTNFRIRVFVNMLARALARKEARRVYKGEYQQTTKELYKYLNSLEGGKYEEDSEESE